VRWQHSALAVPLLCILPSLSFEWRTKVCNENFTIYACKSLWAFRISRRH